MAGPPRALILDRNRTLARRLNRVLVSVGYQSVALTDESALTNLQTSQLPADDLLLLVSEAAGLGVVLSALRAPGSGQRAAVLYGTAEELDLIELLAEPGVIALLGTRPPRGSQSIDNRGAARSATGASPTDVTLVPAQRSDLEAELLGVARHLRGAPLPPLQAHLLWGAQAYCTDIANIGGREAAVTRIVSLCMDQLGTSRRVADSAGEVVHELITNAMYDAPIDHGGQPRYAHDRTAPVDLPPEDRVTFRYGTDGLRLGLEVADRFGRLGRLHLQGSLRRATAGQVNRDRGGAGLGLSLIYRSCQTLQVDVEPGLRTRVTVILDLDPQRPGDLGPRPGKSVIFPDRPDRTDRPVRPVRPVAPLRPEQDRGADALPEQQAELP